LNRNLLYHVLYRRWREAPAPLEEGYTVLLPVPADLPVFLKLAMATIARQDAAHRRETLVLPDASSSGFEGAFHRYLVSWPARQPIRIVPFGPLSRALAQRQRNPGLNHWLQFVHGVTETRSVHALLHDADLFIADGDFLKKRYEAAAQSGAACFGVSPVWDDWYRATGYGHVVATWELFFDVRWARSFEPWQHRGHEDVIDGMRHIFDTTLLPQCRTEASRIVLSPPESEFTHFNYVICTYRLFQRSQGSWEDEHFRLLLVRLLIDAVDDSGWSYEVPALADLARGLSDPSARVTYTSSATREHYPEFRGKLERLISGNILGEDAAASIQRGIGPFDEAMGWSGSAGATGDAEPLCQRTLGRVTG
jgi:hypothetical protein